MPVVLREVRPHVMIIMIICFFTRDAHQGFSQSAPEAVVYGFAGRVVGGASRHRYPKFADADHDQRAEGRETSANYGGADLDVGPCGW